MRKALKLNYKDSRPPARREGMDPRGRGRLGGRLGTRLMDGYGLTADEAEQYDRQIRLWGLEAQKR